MNENDRKFFMEAWNARNKLNEISCFLFGHYVTESSGSLDDVDTYVWDMVQYYLLSLVKNGEFHGDDEMDTITKALSAETEEEMLAIISNYISAKNGESEV